eukprot:1139347-Pelagomonas_calceolata.AAC.2
MPRPAPLLAKQDSLSGNTMRNFENELAALAPVSGCAPRRGWSMMWLTHPNGKGSSIGSLCKQINIPMARAAAPALCASESTSQWQGQQHWLIVQTSQMCVEEMHVEVGMRSSLLRESLP